MLLTYLSLLHPIIISISAHNHVIRSLSCILGGAYLHIGSFIHGSNSLMVIYQIYFLHLKNQNVCHILDLFTTSLYRNIVLVKFLIWSFKHVMILSWSIVMIALTFSYCSNFPLPDGKSCLLWPWWHSTWNCQFLLVKVILNKMWLKLVLLFHYFIWVVCYVLMLYSLTV